MFRAPFLLGLVALLFSLYPAHARDSGLIAGEAEFVEARGGFGFLGGPATERSGDLYFTDEPPGFLLIRFEKYVC